MLWRRARKAIAVIALALFWLLSAGWLTAPLLAAVQQDASHYPTPRFGPSTVIVVLGGGTRHDAQGKLIPKNDVFPRLATAASTYAECRQEGRHCQVIVSGGDPEHHGTPEAENAAPYLVAANVAPNDIVLETASETTYENAKYVARILRSEHYDSLMLVTSAYHMQRALLDFSRFGLTPTPVPASGRSAHRGLLPRRPNLMAANVALHELIGTAQFYVYRALGWF